MAGVTGKEWTWCGKIHQVLNSSLGTASPKMWAAPALVRATRCWAHFGNFRLNFLIRNLLYGKLVVKNGCRMCKPTSRGS